MSTRNDNPLSEEALPSVKETSLSPIELEDEISVPIIRRQKVRELHGLGYEAEDIRKILSKGIKINNILTKIPCSINQIKEDLIWIIQEGMAADTDIEQKKQEIKMRLNFLYNRAMIEYVAAKGGVKNSFLNTAKTILDKIAEIEGVSVTQHSVKLFSETKPAQIADEVKGGYNEDEQFAIDASIEKILAERKRRRIRKLPMVSEKSGIRTQTSENEGVSGESKIHKSTGPAKTE